ncbi:hypothetical protein WN48_09784 [Eufriesea mexicana]|uniref:Uncharacterized protein n=1 Tax=Eufriesea mexicana TaxID=516756 RepID=A0A310SEX2_9HYME|nr:hypothetical protein WN48_09784 [Eufriesea mexicana]
MNLRPSYFAGLPVAPRAPCVYFRSSVVHQRAPTDFHLDIDVAWIEIDASLDIQS